MPVQRKDFLMIFKASVDYGIRTIVYLAVKGDVCSSREISEEMAVPRDYLIQLALHLRQAGIIKARPGKNGGYELAKAPEKITLGEIIGIFDGENKGANRPLKKRKKSDADIQEIIRLHSAIIESFDSYLNAITVKTLLDMWEKNGSSSSLVADELEAEASRLRKGTKTGSKKATPKKASKPQAAKATKSTKATAAAKAKKPSTTKAAKTTAVRAKAVKTSKASKPKPAKTAKPKTTKTKATASSKGKRSSKSK